MQAKSDKTQDDSDWYFKLTFFLKCMAALIAAAALVALIIYGLTPAAPITSMAASTAADSDLFYALGLIALVALCCIIPFAVGGDNSYYQQTHCHNGYTPGYSAYGFWRAAPAPHAHVHNPGGYGYGHNHAHSHAHAHSSSGGAGYHGHNSGSGGAGMGHNHNHSHGHSAGMGMGNNLILPHCNGHRLMRIC